MQNLLKVHGGRQVAKASISCTEYGKRALNGLDLYFMNEKIFVRAEAVRHARIVPQVFKRIQIAVKVVLTDLSETIFCPKECSRVSCPVTSDGISRFVFRIRYGESHCCGVIADQIAP